MASPSSSFEKLKISLIKYDQNHLIEAYEKLHSDSDKEELLNDLTSIDFEEMCNNFKRYSDDGSGTSCNILGQKI